MEEDTMLCMRSLTSGEYRLTANTVSEITEALDRLAISYGRTHKFQGRKLKSGPLLNAVVLHFLLLPEGQRAAIVEETIPKLEKLLETEGDVLGFLDIVEQRRPQPSWDSARDASPTKISRKNKKSG